jgi:large subunit ribosomal protein L35Ae
MGMKAVITNFRRGRHTQRMNQLLLEIPGVDSKALASGFIGKRVKWTSPGRLKKEIFGKITHTHGNNGVVRARFSRGLPGDAIGKKIDILE